MGCDFWKAKVETDCEIIAPPSLNISTASFGGDVYPLAYNAFDHILNGVFSADNAKLWLNRANTLTKCSVNSGNIASASLISNTALNTLVIFPDAQSLYIDDGTAMNLVETHISNKYGQCFSADGLIRVAMNWSSGVSVDVYTLTTPFDETSETFLYSKSFPYDIRYAFCFNNSGTYFFIVNETHIRQYELSVAFDLTTATLLHSRSIDVEMSYPSPSAAFMALDDSALYVCPGYAQSAALYQYTF